MSKRAFDRKFGEERIAQLPMSPGVYLFKDAAEKVVYVGKAKNLRRRLSQYRNAGRRKVHRKMRLIVREAMSLHVETLADEQAALLRENELIVSLRPPLNVDGAFAFLYLAIGLVRDERRTLLCLTTDTAAYEAMGLTWYGSFRSRIRAKEAFAALVDLLCRSGHVERRSALPPHRRRRGSRFVGFRQIDASVHASLDDFLAGRSDAFVRCIALDLLDRSAARRDAKLVEEKLKLLASFYETDVLPLRQAMIRCGREPGFVEQEERDALYIKARSA